MTASFDDYSAIKDRHRAPGDVERRFKLKRFRDIELPSDGIWLIKNLIPRESLVVVYGAPKCGKSFLVFDLVMHVALGRPYRDKPVIQGAVVYVAAEGAQGLRARAEAFRREKMTGDTADPPFYLLTGKISFASDVDHIIAAIREQTVDGGCDVIVLDTLNRVIEGSENDVADMGEFIGAADRIREAFDCTVIVIHHCGIERNRPRGHTSLSGAADAQIRVERDGADQIVATVEWMKDGPEGEIVISVLKPVEIGTDNEGEPLTSCIVIPAEGGSEPVHRRARLSTAQELALRQLHDAVNRIGEIPPQNDHVPHDRAAVRVVTWRQYCYTGIISEGEQAAQQESL